MVPVDLTQKISARALAFGEADDSRLLSAMSANMPRDGIAEPNMRGRRQLPPASYQMINGRILENALGFLNEDISAPFLAGLSKYRALSKAATDSLNDPNGAELMVSLIDPYEIKSTQRPYIALLMDDAEIARITFEITFVFGMFATAVAVRRGAIESVACDACSLALTLSLQNWPNPLLKLNRQLKVRLPVRPPIPIPLTPRS